MWSMSTSHRFRGARIEGGTVSIPRMDRKIGEAMRIPLLIGSIVLLAACAGASPRPYSDEGGAGRLHVVLWRHGLLPPMAVELSAQDRDWRRRLSLGRKHVPPPA